jgi:hypothetical protein
MITVWHVLVDYGLQIALALVGILFALALSDWISRMAETAGQMADLVRCSPAG